VCATSGNHFGKVVELLLVPVKRAISQMILAIIGT